MDGPIRIEPREGFWRIVLDRPDRLNAFDRAMHEALAEALSRAEAERSAAALLEQRRAAEAEAASEAAARVAIEEQLAHTAREALAREQSLRQLAETKAELEAQVTKEIEDALLARFDYVIGSNHGFALPDGTFASPWWSSLPPEWGDRPQELMEVMVHNLCDLVSTMDVQIVAHSTFTPAALYALEHHVERLAEDHALAARLADGLGGIAGLRVEAPQTNMVWVTVDGGRGPALLAHLAARGVLATGDDTLRLVTHLDVDRAGVDHAVVAVHDFFEGA